MNPRNNPKADTYILAWKSILYGKRHKLAHSKRLERQAFIKFMKGF